MCAEKNINRLVRRMMLHFKSMGLLFWVPVAFSYALIPVIALLTYRKYGLGEETAGHIQQFSLLLMPLFSCWWPIFLLRNYVEADGNELLFVCRPRIKAADVILPFLVYWCGCLLQYLLYTIWMPRLAGELVRLATISLFYLGLSFCLIFLSRSVTITLMTVLIYGVANSLAPSFIRYTGFPFYYQLEFLNSKTLLQVCLPMALGGIALFLLGCRCNHKLNGYN